MVVCIVAMFSVLFLSGFLCGYHYSHWEHLKEMQLMNKTDEERRLREKENDR